MLDQPTLDRLVKNATAKKDIYGAVFYVSSGTNSLDLIAASGEMREDAQYYVASINKFFVSSIILRLCTENRLHLDDKISGFLPEEMVRGLHVHRGTDYSRDLSVAHLMSHTSGLPCYLTDRQSDGTRAIAGLEAGVDQSWPVDKVVNEVKRMKTHFPPGQRGRAKYADTNHQLLSQVIQRITGEPVNIALKNLFRELGLARTYVCEDTEAPIPLRYKSQEIHIPLFLNSTQNEIVSSARDQMTFLKAFFSGHFFPKERLSELEKWNDIFFPFKYGVGIQKFHMPRFLSPFRHIPDMIGHSGSTGSVAFHVPEVDVYITGSTNQQARPRIAFQAMMKIVNYC